MEANRSITYLLDFSTISESVLQEEVGLPTTSKDNQDAPYDIVMQHSKLHEIEL